MDELRRNAALTLSLVAEVEGEILGRAALLYRHLRTGLWPGVLRGCCS